MIKLATRRSLLAAHLLVVCLLPGVFVLLLSQGNITYYVPLLWAWIWLARLLIGWVVVLVGWQLWQWRWGRVVALALLVGVDVLVLYGYQVMLFVAGMAADPS